MAILLIWAFLLSWIDKDSVECRLPRQAINSGLLGGLVLAFIILVTAPLGLAVGLAVFFGIMLVEVGGYLGLRYKKVGLSDIMDELKEMVQTKGKKKQKDIKAAAGQVVIINKAGVPMSAPDPSVPERSQYDAAQLFLGDGLRKGAERIDLVTSSDGASVSYTVDGFVHQGPTMDRSSASGAVNYLKFVTQLDVSEKRKPQAGIFKTSLNGSKREMQLNTRGSSSGESMTVIADPKKRHPLTLDMLGFSAEQLDTVRKTITDMGGLVLLAAPPRSGLTGLEYGIIRGHDAFLQHILTIERATEADLEGVTQNTLPTAATPAEEAKQVTWVVSQEPDVILMASIEDSNSARDLAGFAENPAKRVYVGLRSGSALEALRHWRKLVGDDNLVANSLRLIIAARTVRILCEACKIGYTPDPTLLKKLNMDPARVKTLYQARTTPARDAKGNPVPCEACNDLAFKGRSGVYELLLVDDEMKQLIVNNGTESQIKNAFRKQRGRYLQEMALELVEQGLTSVNEVQRVLRPAEAAAKKS
ncbi:MAG TPA: ATPase, T2SS/T4P/T4SS family [Tepidisphaeraceae bacterium]|nr:ATPase, T2SS/T4P/T4SS family [Tepidisphaeraceae bacterium]